MFLYVNHSNVILFLRVAASMRLHNSRTVTKCTFAHVFGDDVDGLLRHNSVQLHQLVVAELLHDLGLLQEGLGRHGAGLQGLDGHLGGAVPRA